MPKVTLVGDLDGDYFVREARPDGSLVLVPITAERANGLCCGGTGTTPAEPVALVADDRALVAPGLAAFIQDAATQAVRLRYGYLGSEHLLLALANARSGLASQVLVTVGVSAPRVAKIVQEIVPPGEQHYDHTELPLTPRARDAIVLATHEALGIGSGHDVRPDHLLMALMQIVGRHQGSVAASVLRTLGVEPDDVRDRVADRLAGELEL